MWGKTRMKEKILEHFFKLAFGIFFFVFLSLVSKHFISFESVVLICLTLIIVELMTKKWMMKLFKRVINNV